MTTAYHHKAPGTPKLSALALKGGFHGRSIGCLSVSHSKPLFKLDVPMMDWPRGPFPEYLYPLEDHRRENEQEDIRCLEEIEDIIYNKSKSDSPVAAVIAEPIQSEGGDRHASGDFFRKLQKIVRKYEAAFILDEVQTGCGGTGVMWNHEYFNLPEPPDMVTFGKKMLMGGIYTHKQFLPKEGYRIQGTWMGDPPRLQILQALLEEIKKENLLLLVKETGNVLLSGLKELQEMYPSLIHSARGVGTYCAVSGVTASIKDKLIYLLRQKGFIVWPCGQTSLRLRPALIMQPKHAHYFLTGMEDVLKEMNIHS
jgi:4-aminobutyrate aminotransferase/(S)-3-amino-2-methylpropionate transaminase